MRRKLSKEARRETIKQVAIRLFEQRGYENVTIAGVISESDVARGTFYLHFESLEALLIEWFDDVIEETWKRMRPYLEDLSIPFETCTRQVIQEVFTLFAEHPSMSKVFYSGGGETFMQRRHEALFLKLGGKLFDALRVRHPEHGEEMKTTVAILISLVSDMANYAGQYITPAQRNEFEEHVTTFALAGLRVHLDKPSTY